MKKLHNQTRAEAKREMTESEWQLAEHEHQLVDELIRLLVAEAELETDIVSCMMRDSTSWTVSSTFWTVSIVGPTRIGRNRWSGIEGEWEVQTTAFGGHGESERRFGGAGEAAVYAASQHALVVEYRSKSD